VRALLIVNPNATTTTPLRRDVIVSALASEINLEVTETRYRGHAAALAAGAVSAALDLVLTLGGDGTVNEVVNGLFGSPHAGRAPLPAGRLPALAPIPGGNANVFTRSLGLPADPIDATGRILAAISGGQTRSIGLGLADDRYFTFSAGLGLDAEVVRVIDGQRATGRKVSTPLYVWTALRHYYTRTDRRHPALILERPGQPPVDSLFFGIVSNTAPWTYVGSRAVNPSPQADFEAGLDLFAFRRLRTFSTLNAVRQMMSKRDISPNGRHVLSLHDEAKLTLRCRRPIALQVDGEYMGERDVVVFRAIPHALRVTA
jgi:diacylglycerol kinase family enzyme